ncbi:MAG: hypothetical protein ACOC97_04785, partial [Myxococcota bacterium]
MSARAKTLALGRPDTAHYRSIGRVLFAFGDLEFAPERRFRRPEHLLARIRQEGFDQVLLPNPYGNPVRLGLYRALREAGVRTVVSERGALPGSWYFDHGFNADSPSYDPAQWNHPLDDAQGEAIRRHVEELRSSSEALERQGPRRSLDELRQDLGATGRRVLLVPLQRPTDTVVQHFSGDVAGVEGVVAVAERLGALLDSEDEPWRVVLKKHPLEDRAPPLRGRHTAYAPDDAHVHDLLELADAVLTLNSGVGVLALAFGKPTLVLGRAFYAHPGLAVPVASAEEAHRALRQGSAPDPETARRFLFHLRHRVYSFGTFTTEEQVRRDGTRLRITRRIDFRELRILGRDVPLPKASALVVSPVIPWPAKRGSETRIDVFLRSMMDQGLLVSLCAMTGRSDPAPSTIERRLRDRYPGLHRLAVVPHPRWSSPGRRAAHRLRRATDWITGDAHRVANRETCPPTLRRTVHRLCRELAPDYLVVNYAKLAPCVPPDFRGTRILDTHDYQTKFLEEDQEKNGIRR